MHLIYIAICWGMGIWLGSRLTLSADILLLTAIISTLLSIILYWRKLPVLPIVCFGLLCAGACRYQTALPIIDDTHVASYNEQTVALVGIVDVEPDVRDRFVYVRLATESVTPNSGTTQFVSGKVRVRLFRYPEIAYGSRIEVVGTLEKPSSEGEFDYAAYLSRQGVHSVVEFPDVTILKTGVGNGLLHRIFELKERGKSAVITLIPDPEAALLNAMLLGDRSGMPETLTDSFRATNLSHIISVSGFHVAIIAAMILTLCEAFLPKRLAAIVAVLGLIAYAILVGARPSVIRAALMASTYLFATRFVGRPSFGPAALSLAALLMTYVNPQILWDVGFQLSFAATLGIMLFLPRWRPWLMQKLDRRFGETTARWLMLLVGDLLIVTLSAQIFTLPLTLLYFEQFSVIGLFANLLILPAQPLSLIFGAVAALVGTFSTLIAQPFAWVAWLGLRYTTFMATAFGATPLATVNVSLAKSAVFLIYLGLLAVVWYLYQRRKRQHEIRKFLGQDLVWRGVVGLSAVFFFLAFFWTTSRPDGLLHVTFFDVGQGDSIFIQTPTGRQILIDGGLYPSELNAHLGRAMPFADRQLDMLIATHPDADHVQALPDVLERYDIDLLVTEGTQLGESSIFDAVLNATNNIPTHTAMQGEIIEIGDGVRLEIVHPDESRDPSIRNNNSVSMRVLYDNFSLLLTGDAEEQAEREMVRSGVDLSAVIYKAGHHGSNTSSKDFFLDAVQPQIVVVSAGAENRFGHPDEAVLARTADIGATLLSTIDLGTIEVITDGKTMWWESNN